MEKLPSAHAGHDDVRQQKMYLFAAALFRETQGVFAVFGRNDVVTFFREDGAGKISDGLLVLDQQNGFGPSGLRLGTGVLGAGFGGFIHAGKINFERRPPSQFAVHFDVPAVLLHNPVARGKPEARPFVLSFSGEKPEKITLSVKGPKTVLASDMKMPATVKLANPDLVLANLSKGAKLEAEILVESGFGYLSVEEREVEQIGTIPVDAIFSPILRVNYEIEETRVGRLTNYDKLILDIWTDGTVDPKEALIQSSEILISYLNQIVSPKKVVKEEVAVTDEGLGMVGKLSVEEIGLPTRVANALIKTGYDTVEKLVSAKQEDLVKVRNLGEKSLKIIRIALKEKGVDWNE